MSRASLAALVATLGFGYAAEAAAQQVVTTRDVNVRQGPAVTSTVITKVDSGVVLDVVATKAHYERVELAGGQRGWIYERYLAPLAASAGAITTVAGIEALPKTEAREANDPACRNEGAGNVPADGQPNRQIDSATNLLKNRIDDGRYADVSIGAILKLPWSGLPRQRFGFSSAQLRATAKYEQAAIRLTGYLAKVVEEGKESTNCELDTHDWRDWHVWLVNSEAEVTNLDRTAAVVFEVTPRVRRANPQLFDLHQFQSWAHAHQKVRVSGWLMLDPEHPDQVGKSRGTTWEIHPTMKVEAVP